MDISTALTTSLLAATRGSQLKSRKETMRKLLTFCLFAFLTFGIAPAAFSQVTVAPFTTAQVQFFDNSGNACASCQLQTFAAGTTTPLASYSDPGVTLNANPIILDSAGVATIFLTSASYKFVLKGSVASGGATIRTVDNITWATPLSTFNGITSTGDVILQQSTAATSGANQSSNNLKIQGRYWTGSADATETCQLQNVLGTGANPSVTLTLTCSGSSGTVTFSIPSAAVSFGGSTTLNGGTLNGSYAGNPTFSNLLTAPGFASQSANASSAGAFRLAIGDTACWRNFANGANVCLSNAGAGSSATGGFADNLKWSGAIQAAAFVGGGTALAGSGVLNTANNVCAVAAENSLSNGDICAVKVNGSNQAVIGSGPFIIPAAADTAVGKATTDTLINKTLISPMITNPSATGLTANRIAVASDFTTANNTSLQNITGLSWTFPATAATYSFHCAGTYSQATANVAVTFGIQAVTNNPTNIMANGQQQLTIGSPATFNTGTTLTSLATTAATAIVAGVPGATATGYTFYLDGTLELAASANTVNIMVSTAAGADAVTIKRGSYCNLF